MKSWLNVVALIMAYECGILIDRHDHDWWAWIIYVVIVLVALECLDIWADDRAKEKYYGKRRY